MVGCEGLMIPGFKDNSELRVSTSRAFVYVVHGGGKEVGVVSEVGKWKRPQGAGSGSSHKGR
jgi:hypothetical protein